MKVKEESGKGGLKLNIQKTKIMASGPITSWQIDGEKLETVTDFISLGSKITADSDSSHEIKRLGRKAMTNLEIKGFMTSHEIKRLGRKSMLLGRKAMTNLDSILKSRDITLPTKICIVKISSRN